MVTGASQRYPPSFLSLPVTAFGKHTVRCQAASRQEKIFYLNWMKFELQVMLLNKYVVLIHCFYNVVLFCWRV